MSSVIKKSITLRPNSTIPNISVLLGPGASVISNTWNINVTTQQGTDLQIILGSDYGFHPIYNSSIELLIHGNTHINTLNTDGEIIFIYNVNDEYFAQLKSLETSKENPYQQCPNQNTPLITTNISKIVNPSTPNRYNRYCTTTWQNTGNTNYKDPVVWPMFLRLHNDPINNLLHYIWGDFTPSNPGEKFDIKYTSSFTPNQGLNIHISGDNMNENFNITQIIITYAYITTPAPTESPTIFPTTSIPTTTIPTTNKPSYIPTIIPTITPTIITNIPTIYPTIIPTNIPTIYPTFIPSNIPTYIPTYIPTIYPTMNPITISPTLIPTYSPTFAPSAQLIVEFPTVSPTYVILKSTLFDTEDSDTAMNETAVITLNLEMSLMILIALLIFGGCCFLVGICFGRTFFKKKSDEKNEFNAAPEIEKQMSNFMTDKRLHSTDNNNNNKIKIIKKIENNIVNINENDVIPTHIRMNTDNTDANESLYATEDNIFCNSIETARSPGGPSSNVNVFKNAKKSHHIKIESESMNIPPIPPKQTGRSGEMDDGIKLENENKNHNPPQVYISSPPMSNKTYLQNNNSNISLQVPKKQKYSHHKNNHKNNNSISVHYSDVSIDEKENKITKKETIGNNNNNNNNNNNTKLMMKIFPNDDEGIEKLQRSRSNEKSIGGYSSLRDSEDDNDNDEYYNSDPNEDEDQKYMQNLATLGIEIEMENTTGNIIDIDNNNKKVIAQNKQQAKHFKMLEKIMLDESVISCEYEESDDIGPLPGADINLSGQQYLSSIIIPSINKSIKRKSQSEISSSGMTHKTNKSGNTFITLYHEQKENHIDELDDDDDELDDPEYIQEIHENNNNNNNNENINRNGQY